ncbi:auxin efflux carrier [Slackia heliotrinireducens]|uniref:Predicted permease n=1 Tax=Slackia heliotrinireducens (strain ATCC 29202 / DSM 20476 / NCTC 11029 / RHS 1) TaxID=471855 RepID=C7N529_SLAHD|nr:AEC family transporter [Slackia heliotrinireducens]ACV22014.1 predicted permease [Slackia heliotrinireducens DSM 20476]VEG99931.1 auxin efflux carrier [Slackia heliotrinireducens]
MESLAVALNAVMPFFVYLMVGKIARALHWADEDFFSRLNTFSFNTLFPIMMFSTVYQVETDYAVNWLFVGTALASVLIVIGIAMAAVPRLVGGPPRQAVVVEALHRSNIILFALPLTYSIYGDECLIPVTSVIALIVPTYNIVAVMIFEYFRGASPTPLSLAKSVIKNPLIQGFIVATLVRFLHIDLPGFLDAPIHTLGSIATPLALIALGGTLHIHEMQDNMGLMVPVLIIKMIVLPLCILPLSLALPFSGVERFVLLVMYAAPVATATFPMASTMDGDGPLAGELVVLSTVVSVGTLFVWIVALGTAGLL